MGYIVVLQINNYLLCYLSFLFLLEVVGPPIEEGKGVVCVPFEHSESRWEVRVDPLAFKVHHVIYKIF